MAAPAVRPARGRRLGRGRHAASLPARRRRLRQLLPGAGGRGSGLGGRLQPLPASEPRGDEAAARGSHRAAGHHQGPRGAQDAEHPAGAAQGVGVSTGGGGVGAGRMGQGGAEGAWGHVGKDGPSEADGAISAVAKREA